MQNIKSVIGVYGSRWSFRVTSACGLRKYLQLRHSAVQAPTPSAPTRPDRSPGQSLTAAGVYHAFLYTGIPGSGGTMSDLGTSGAPPASALASTPPDRPRGGSTTASDDQPHFILALPAVVPND